MSTRQNLLNEFEGIDNYMQAVREVLENGHMPDMRGLDDRVANLCAALEQASPEIQQECMLKLQNMLERLDECESHIRAFHEQHSKEHS